MEVLSEREKEKERCSSPSQSEQIEKKYKIRKAIICKCQDWELGPLDPEDPSLWVPNHKYTRMVSNPHKKGQLTGQDSSSTHSTEESSDSEGETNSDEESMLTINTDKSTVDDYSQDSSTKPIKEKPDGGEKKLITYSRKKKTSEAPAPRRAIESIELSPARKKTRIIDPQIRTISNGQEGGDVARPAVRKVDSIKGQDPITKESNAPDNDSRKTNPGRRRVTSRTTGSPVSPHFSQL